MSTPRATDEVETSHESLRQELLLAATVLARRRQDLLSLPTLTRLLAQGWLEWHAGRIRLSRLGTAVCDEVLATQW